MLDSRWQKVLADLWKNRTRTLIVALAIGVGVYAVGVVVNARTILVREYESDQAGALPASAIIQTYPFGDDLAEGVARLPGVASAEGRTLVHTLVYDESGTPRDLVLVALPEPDKTQLDAVTPLGGRWPPGRREVVLERMSPDYLGVRVGHPMEVELDSGVVKTLVVIGTAHDAQKPSPEITGTSFGYISVETLEGLGIPTTHNELRIRVAENAGDEEHILSVLAEVEGYLRRAGRPILGRSVITESLAAPFIDTVVLILTAFGLVILVLSGFLVVNAMSSLITQQIPHIGVMKLVGARRGQIVSLYLATILVYGLLAIGAAIPLSLLTARLLMTAMVNNLLNVMPESYTVPVALLLVQAGVGVLLPLLAGLTPVLRGTRTTTQQALDATGLGAGGYGRGWVDRLIAPLERFRRMQRPILLALRNTLRHKGRLVQTLLVLTLGTALFISVISARASVNTTLESFLQFHRYDVAVDLGQPERAARLEPAGGQVPGITEVEVWSVSGATRLRPGDSESDFFALYAVPAGTTFMAPEILSGVWLAEAGEVANPIVVNKELLDAEPDLQVGSDIELEIEGRSAAWRIVGVVPAESRGAAVYVRLEDYAYGTRTVGQGSRLVARTATHDAAAQEEAAARLSAVFGERGIEVKGTQTTEMVGSENSLLFTIVVSFLILMALLLAAVGGLGLATTMSINIMERVREIGVLRAVGASNAAVSRIVVAEGIVIGLISWLAGAALSLLISPALSSQLGLALINAPLNYQYSWLAALGWFFAVQAVAVVASLGPAQSAVRLTVREVLAYE
jgi:putative ABC transport system permease protein